LIESIPLNPRWAHAYSSARDFIKERDIRWLPVDLFDIYQNEGWLITTADYGCELFPNYDWSNFYSDEIDAVTYKKNGYYITIYNEKFPIERIRWTLAHEIGHIKLGHLDKFGETKFFRSGLTEEKYGVLEQEAHAFASELLTPSVPLLACHITESCDIQRECLVSKEAAVKREITLKKRKTQGIFIKEVIFYKLQFSKFIFQRKCSQCNHYFVIPEAKFCPICGDNAIKWGKDKDSVVYEEIKLDSQGKAIVCPVCGNEKIMAEGDYCHICGTNLVNKCMGTIVEYDRNEPVYENACDNRLLLGNARHCHHCGGVSSYHHHNVLMDWNEAEESKKQSAASFSDF